MPNVQRFEKISYYKNVIDDPKSLINLIEESDKNLTSDTSIPSWQEWNASGDSPYQFGYQKRFNNNVEADTSLEIKKNKYDIKKCYCRCI